MARNFIRYIDQIPGVLASGSTPSASSPCSLRRSTSAWAISPPARWWCATARRSPRYGDDTGSRTFTAASFIPQVANVEPHRAVTLPADGVARLTAGDLEVLEGFFARRLDVPLEVRESWPRASPPPFAPNPAWRSRPASAPRPFSKLQPASSATCPGCDSAHTPPSITPHSYRPGLAALLHARLRFSRSPRYVTADTAGACEEGVECSRCEGGKDLPFKS